MLVFDTSGNFLAKTNPQASIDGKSYSGSFSPDFRSLLIQKENDFWISSIDLLKGEVAPPRQLTRFGFQGNQEVWAWYKNGVALGSQYWINVSTGEVQDINIPENYKQILKVFYPNSMINGADYRFSADHRFVIYGMSVTNQNTTGDIIDISNNKLILPDTDGQYFYSYWLKNRQLILYNRARHMGAMYTLLDDDKFNTTEIPIATFPGEDPRVTKIKGVSNLLVPEDFKYGRGCFSPDTTKYLQNEGDCGLMSFGTKRACTWYVYEPLSGNVKRIDEGLECIAWADNDHLVFCKLGSTNEQGTYIHDLKSGTSKKLFSYVIDNAFNLPRDKVLYNQKNNYILFGANNILWRCRPDGSELTELVKGFTTDITIRPFLTAVVD